MKVEFHIKGVVITDRQKAQLDKKLRRLKRYMKDEPMTVDAYLRDETSPEKGGVDQSVELSTVIYGEKIFVKEVDSRLLRAFAYAQKKFERKISEFHKKRIDRTRQGDNHLDRLLKALRVKK